MSRVYADVNQNMPRAYWDYDSVNISWGVLENYEVVRKIGRLIVSCCFTIGTRATTVLTRQVAASTPRSLRASTSSTTRSA